MGVAKPHEAAMVVAMTNGMCCTPSACAVAMAMGNISAAAALLLITSVKIIVKAYTAASQLPEYVEATLTLINPKSRRVAAEMRLCESCHKNANVTLKNGQAQVRALAISWPEETK